MSGRGKGGKGLGKGGAKRHRNILRDNIQGITKPEGRYSQHIRDTGGISPWVDPGWEIPHDWQAIPWGTTPLPIRMHDMPWSWLIQERLCVLWAMSQKNKWTRCLRETEIDWGDFSRSSNRGRYFQWRTTSEGGNAKREILGKFRNRWVWNIGNTEPRQQEKKAERGK